MYKKKPLNFTYEQVSRNQRLAETLKTRESSRFKRLSVIRSIDDSSFTPVKDENSSKIEVSTGQPYKPTMTTNENQKKQPVSRLDMLRKWKEEKLLKKELEAKEKKKPFYVGGNTKNVANSKNPPNFKASFTFNSKDFNSTTLSSKSNTPLSQIQPKSVIPCATKQKIPSFLPSKIPNVRQMKPVVKSAATVNKGYITPTYQKKCTNTASSGIISQNKSATKPLSNDKKPNNVSVPNKPVKASGLQKPLNYKSQPIPVSKLPVKPVSKVVSTLPKPTSSISKGIPDRRIQSKMPVMNGNHKSTVSKNPPQKMPVPPTNQKPTTSSNLPQKGQNFSSSNMQRKGYCFKKAITESQIQAKNALTTKTDKKPDEVKATEVKSLQKEEISIPDVPFDSSLSMIKPNSFAPTGFTFRPPILMASFVLDDDEANLTEVIERAKLKYMTRTSTPAKPIEGKLAVQSPCSPVMKMKDSMSDVSTHLCKEIDESCEQLAVRKLVLDIQDPEPSDKKSGECSNECKEKENSNVNGSFVNESFKQIIVKAVADNAEYTTETADDKDSKLFNICDGTESNADTIGCPVNETFELVVVKDLACDEHIIERTDDNIKNQNGTESNADTIGCPVNETFEQVIVKDLACDEHVIERTDDNIKNLSNKHDEEENNDNVSLANVPFKELVDDKKLVYDGSHVVKPENEKELLNTIDENKDDVNGTFLKESSEQLIVKEIISNEEYFDDKNDSSLFTKCIGKENDSSRILIVDEPCEQLIVKELASGRQALDIENTDELGSVKQISDGVSEKIVREELRLTFGEKSFIGDENDAILIPVSPFDDSLVDIPNIHESKVSENFQALSLESGAEIKQDKHNELVKLEAEVEATKAVKKKSTGAIPKRTSIFRHLSILNSVAETDESFSKTPGKEETFTPRRSKRISDRVFSDSPKECSASNIDSPGSCSVFTPRRRSTRLQKKSPGNFVSQDNFNSPLESQKSSRNTPRRSMRLIDLNTPEKESDGAKKTERLLSIDFEKLNLKNGSENLDPSKFSIQFENSEESFRMRSKKVSLLYSPEKRKSLRKSIKGDLMSFSPSS